MKRGKEIKSRNSSQCKVFKYARREDYDVLDWDQDRQPMNRQPSSRHTEVGEVPGEGNVVGKRRTVDRQSRRWNPGDHCEPELLRGKLFTGTLSHTEEKGEGVVSRPPTCPSPCLASMRLDSMIVIIIHYAAKTWY